MTTSGRSDVTRILARAEDLDRGEALDQLLPIVYQELRAIAVARLRDEPSGHTLQATALVHEAYMRLIGADLPPWKNRAQFFYAAAEAMRRILVDHARRRLRVKRGGGRVPVPLEDVSAGGLAGSPRAVGSRRGDSTPGRAGRPCRRDRPPSLLRRTQRPTRRPGHSICRSGPSCANGRMRGPGSATPSKTAKGPSRENEMDQSQNDLVKQVFQEALERPGSERVSFVDAACEGDSEARDRVVALLGAYDDADGFLASPTLPPEAVRGAGVGVNGSGGFVGTRIGPYKLLQVIGEGGFGVVYMAEQEEPIRRRVALKLVKLGMDTKEVIARFEAERPGPRHDGASQHRPGAGRRRHRDRPALLRHGAGPGRPHHRVLRRELPEHSGASRALRPGLPRGPARPSEGHRPPGPEAVERDGDPPRRPGDAEGDRLRRGPGPSPTPSPTGPSSPSSVSSSARPRT